MVQSRSLHFSSCCRRHPQSTPHLYKKGDSPHPPKKGVLLHSPDVSPSNMPPKGEQYTTMTDKVCIALCEHHDKNPQLIQKDLIQWLD